MSQQQQFYCEVMAELHFEDAGLKTCSRCKATKQVTDFRVDRQKKDGLTSMCGDCGRKAKNESRHRTLGAPSLRRALANKPLEERFLSSFQKSETGCWIWIGAAMGPMGYGQISTKRKTLPAHRVSWTIFRGEIPKGLFVLHKCDVPKCVNPDHLFLGTPKDNMADMVKKNRSLKGHRHPSAKLTESQIHEIRASQMSQRALAVKFGVLQQTISDICRRRIWKHI